LCGSAFVGGVGGGGGGGGGGQSGRITRRGGAKRSSMACCVTPPVGQQTYDCVREGYPLQKRESLAGAGYPAGSRAGVVRSEAAWRGVWDRVNPELTRP